MKLCSVLILSTASTKSQTACVETPCASGVLRGKGCRRQTSSHLREKKQRSERCGGGSYVSYFAPVYNEPSQPTRQGGPGGAKPRGPLTLPVTESTMPQAPIRSSSCHPRDLNSPPLVPKVSEALWERRPSAETPFRLASPPSNRCACSPSAASDNSTPCEATRRKQSFDRAQRSQSASLTLGTRGVTKHSGSVTEGR